MPSGIWPQISKRSNPLKLNTGKSISNHWLGPFPYFVSIFSTDLLWLILINHPAIPASAEIHVVVIVLVLGRARWTMRCGGVRDWASYLSVHACVLISVRLACVNYDYWSEGNVGGIWMRLPFSPSSWPHRRRPRADEYYAGYTQKVHTLLRAAAAGPNKLPNGLATVVDV